MEYNQVNNDTKRLFLGIPLSEKVLCHTVSFIANQKEMQGIRWIPKENFHVTACFIGNVITDQTDNLIQMTKNAISHCDQFCLIFRKFCLMPEKRPYMVWAQFDINENFNKLVADIHKAAGVKFNKNKPSIPHVTLARFKDPGLSKKITTDLNKNIPDMIVKEVVLYESVLKPTGAEYKKLFRFRL